MAENRMIGGLDVDTYTSAPLRVSAAAFLDAPPREVFGVISDHAALEHWFPLVDTVNLNRSHAEVRDGVGTIVYVFFGILTIRQYVIAYDPPHLLAYSIEQNSLLIDHMAVIYLEAERYGGTNIVWRHYFRTSILPFISTPLAALALRGLYWLAMDHLIRIFEGKHLSA